MKKLITSIAALSILLGSQPSAQAVDYKYDEYYNCHYVDSKKETSIEQDPMSNDLFEIVAEAARMVRLENAPDSFDMLLSAVKIGPVAIIGIPGEPFSAIGKALKETDGFDMIIPCCNTNGKEGYFPMQDSYDEGGYEARSSNFRAGVGEYIIREGKDLLKSLDNSDV